ncbi:MAG: phosphate ABC transporter permease, partial [Deltaproteobacteria bacterium]|nr:phosphate ABC transporter permease [Deltaproteobacteria bacterium]
MKRIYDVILTFYAWFCGLLLLGAVGTVLGFLLLKGIPALKPELVLGETPLVDALFLRRVVIDGLLPAMTGT